MLALFRNNESFTLFLLAVYIAVLRLPAMMGWVAPPAGEDAAGGWLYRVLLTPVSLAPTVSAIAAAGLVLVQAFAVCRLSDKYRLMEERSWLPGALYGLAASCVPDFLFLSPALLAVTIVPLGLWRLFSVYRRLLAFSIVFDIAFGFVVATFVYPPSFWFVVIGFLGLFSLRSFSRREQIVYLVGLIAPLVILQAVLLWFEQSGVFWQTQWANIFAWPRPKWPETTSMRLAIGVLAGVLLVVALGFNLYYYKRSIQVKKYIDILYWFLLGGTLSAFFRPGSTLDGFLLCMPMAGIFLSYLFQTSRNNPLMELLHLALFAAALLTSSYSRLF